MANLELKGFKGLRDLESLISVSKQDKTISQNLEYLAIDLLQSGKYQPRKEFADESLLELADSIKAQGIIQPLIVRQIETNRYEIIAGERRWRAAKKAELTEVPAIIRNVEDNTALAFALIENIQREDLNPIEKAYALSQLRDEFSMSHAAIAETVGQSRVAVTNILRLLSLEETVKILLQSGKLDMGHARALLTLEPEQQLMLAQKIIEKGLTVRDAEKLVGNIRSPKKASREEVGGYHYDTSPWVNELSKKISSKVDIKLNAKGTGKIIIQVNSPDEIDWLIDHIKID